jgi:tetratricopeptide (TPR) repeat protein
MLDCEIYGLNPLGHHITNVLIHTVNGLLLFWLLTRITGAMWASAFAAAVFAVHPLHVESVAWLAERKDVLSGLFWLLTMLAYVRYAERPNFKRYILVALAFVMGLMSKPMVVTLPFVLFLLDWWPLDRLAWSPTATEKQQKPPTCYPKASLRRLVLEKIPLFVLSGISSVITIIAQKSGGAVSTLERLPLNYRIANVFTSYIRYIGKMLWPSGLAVCYPHPRTGLSDASVVMCVMLFIVLTVLSIYIGRRRRYVAVGWLWYIGTLVPVIGLVQAGVQAMANRYMYISMLGLLIIATWSVKDLIANNRHWKAAAAVLAAIIISSAMILTRMQVKYWQDDMTLYAYALKVTENNALIENNYGSALFDAGRLNEAEQHFNNAIRIVPIFVGARNNLGKVFLRQGKANEAIACFNDVLRQNRDFAEAHYNLGRALVIQKKYDDAIKRFDKALSLDPNHLDAHYRKGLALMATNRPNEAIACFNDVLRQNGDFAEAHYNLGRALVMQKKYDDAIKRFDKALSLDPNYYDALYRKGLALMAANRPDEAIACFNDALRQNKDSAEVHYNLAIALGKQKKYDEAIEHLARVLQLNPMYPEAHNKIGFALQLAGRPDEAIKYLNEGLKINKDQETYANLGSAYIQAGKYDLAIQNLTKAIELKPDNIDVLNKLAWVFAAVDNTSIHNAQKAVEFAQQGCELTGYKDPMLLDTLAVAYAAAGRFDEAKATAEKALSIAKETGRENLAVEIQNRIKLYQANQRYRQK